MGQHHPKIKICGLRTTADAKLLNAAGADYAGFVFHAKSRRNLNYEEAREIMDVLDPDICRVAVVVSPSPERVREIQKLPFDIIQIHGSCPAQTLDAIRIRVWRAVNIAGIGELTVSASEEGMTRISGILVDAKEYGSGKTFDWNAAGQITQAVRRLTEEIDAARTTQGSGQGDRVLSMQEPFGTHDAAPGVPGRGKEDALRPTSKKAEGCQIRDAGHTGFILAGGLHAENVAEGIRLFHPDVVDVSSGVEYDPASGKIGKDPRKVMRFMQMCGRA